MASVPTTAPTTAPATAAPTTASPKNGSISTSIYAIICAVYLWVNYNFMSKPKDTDADADASKIKSHVFAFFFLIIIWFTQFFITFFSLKQQCNTPNYGLAAWSSFATWFVLFVPLFWCLEYLYTWLQPFGNTFGYLIIKMDGLVSFMNSILKSDAQDKVQKYLDYLKEDPWALFSMLTTAETAPPSVNAAAKFEELKGSYFKSNLPADAKTTFVNYVRIKENIAKFIFYILTLNLMADITSIIALENSPCAINIDELAAMPATTNPKPTNAPFFKTSE
jgi:hypothetical protein